MPLINTYPGPSTPRRAAPGSYDADLSRSLGVGGNVLITLYRFRGAGLLILGGAALAAYRTGVFWAFAIAGVIGICIAFCYAELASRYQVAGGD